MDSNRANPMLLAIFGLSDDVEIEEFIALTRILDTSMCLWGIWQRTDLLHLLELPPTVTERFTRLASFELSCIVCSPLRDAAS
eukprot:1168787-Rhodomonas_salina.1